MWRREGPGLLHDARLDDGDPVIQAQPPQGSLEEKRGNEGGELVSGQVLICLEPVVDQRDAGTGPGAGDQRDLPAGGGAHVADDTRKTRSAVAVTAAVKVARP